MGTALSRLLLDTHVFIWYERRIRLSQNAIEAISTADVVFFSAASAWEIVNKRKLGKLAFTGSPLRLAQTYQFSLLPITVSMLKR